VYGSLLATCIALVPLLGGRVAELGAGDDTLPALSFYGTWVMLAVSGVFFSVGSYAFTRAFQEPANAPFCSCRHFATDELVGAWLFLLGSLPYIPFSLLYWAAQPSSVVYCGMTVAAVAFVLCRCARVD
jgi:hypothetical protein